MAPHILGGFLRELFAIAESETLKYVPDNSKHTSFPFFRFVSNVYMLKAAVNEIRKHRGESELDAVKFLKLVREKLKLVEMKEEFLHRSVNEGFSGGEKKRNEIFQMAMLEPKLAILDETDSGLDIDALKVVAQGVNELRDASRSIVMVTHYQRLLDYIVPDYVHVLAGGRVLKSGGKELALELEEHGYGWIEDQTAELLETRA